ncbi:hypothetical protein D3C72_1750380 [compost metagenome]
MAAPAVERGKFRVVVRKIIMRQLDGHAGIRVPEILIRKRRRIIFDMVEHIEPVALLLMHQTNAHFL